VLRAINRAPLIPSSDIRVTVFEPPAPAPDDCDLSPEFDEDILKLLVDLGGLRKALLLPAPVKVPLLR